MTSSPKPWSFFDKIYCISLDTRIDRRTEAKNQFAQSGLLDQVEFVVVKKHPDNPEQGIFNSHMYCLKKGLHAGAKHILIFEDDIFFKKYRPGTLLDAVQFLKNEAIWDAFFLGALSSKTTRTKAQSVARIEYRCLAHAYALKRSFAKQLVQESWRNIPYDDLLRKKCKLCYALSPMIAFQGVASSDNRTFFLDKMRRFFGGLPFIQRANEVYQKHKTLIISLHCLVIVLLILLTMNIWR